MGGGCLVFCQMGDPSKKKRKKKKPVMNNSTRFSKYASVLNIGLIFKQCFCCCCCCNIEIIFFCTKIWNVI